MCGSAMNFMGTGMLYSVAHSQYLAATSIRRKVRMKGKGKAVRTPSSQRLIITRCDKPPILITKRDRIHRIEMVIILLHNLATPHIKLHNLLIPHARHELIVIPRVIPHHMRRLPRRELGLALPRLRVPDLHVAVVARCEELGPAVTEGDIVTGARVPAERAE
jgi:hypothetical protein